MAMIPRQSLWRSERGAELIEFAMVMPLLILLLAGIFDFGMMFRSLEAVTNAAREGARVGVLPGYEDPADVRARVNAYLVGSGLTGSYPLPEVEQVSVATPAGTFTAVAVRVNYPYQLSILGPVGAAFGGSFGTVSLRAASVMRTEAQAAP
jgi:Flp pilus assembly protein TadG